MCAITCTSNELTAYNNTNYAIVRILANKLKFMEKIGLFYKSLHDFVWNSPADAGGRWQQRVVQALRISHLVIRDLLGGMLTLRAMSLVYTSLLSIVPLVAVSFSVLKGFGVHNQVEPMLLELLAPLGERGGEITQRIIEFVDNTKAGVLGSMGLILLLFTVISLVQKIEHSFNYTWRVSEPRSFGQRFSDYLSAIFIGPILIFTAIGITASITGSTIIQQLVGVEAIGVLVKILSRMVPYLLVIAAFAVIYIFVPNTKVKLKSALIGAAVAGVLWETTGWAFASFVVSSTKYTAIYSAFASLIIFMFWLYVSWVILLVGASIAFYHQHPECRNLGSLDASLSNRMKEKVALLLMSIIASNYYAKQAPLTAEALALRLNLNVTVLKPVIDHLMAAQFLVPTKGDKAGYLPGQPVDTLLVTDVIDAIRRADETAYQNIDILPHVACIESFCNRMDSELKSPVDGVTLKDLIPSAIEKPIKLTAKG